MVDYKPVFTEMNPSDDCQDFFVPVTTDGEEKMYRNYPWRSLDEKSWSYLYEPPDLFMAVNNNNTDIFHLLIKLEGYQNDEISVKVFKDMITIEITRPEKFFDGGWESVRIVRRIPLPKGINLEKIDEWISNEVLTIIAPIDHEACKPIDNQYVMHNEAPKMQRIQQQQVQEQQEKLYSQENVILPNLDNDEAKLEAFKDLCIQPSCSTWADAENLFSFFYDANSGREETQISRDANLLNSSSQEKEESPDEEEYSEGSYDLVSNQHDKSDKSEGSGINAGDFASE